MNFNFVFLQYSPNKLLILIGIIVSSSNEIILHVRSTDT